MPPQPCNVLLMSSRLYWYQGVSLLHYQALLGATLVNGEDQRATWRIFRCSPAWTWLKDFYFWLLWKVLWRVLRVEGSTPKDSSIYVFFLNMSSLESKVTVSQKAKLNNGVLKKNTCRFPRPWPCSPLFRSLQIAGFAFISMNTPRQKLKFITNEGEAMFQVCCNAVCLCSKLCNTAV